MRGHRSDGVLVVGHGVRGRAWAEAVERHRQLTLAGVCEPDGDRRADAERVGRRAWPGLAAAIEAGPELAIVATPPATHVTVASALLESAIPVLVEKPLALSAVDAEALAGLARRTRTPALVGQNFRLRRWARTLTEVVAGGGIGSILGGVISTTRPGGLTPADLATSASAALWDVGVHDLDLLRWLVGEVTVESGRCHRDGTCETYEVTLRGSGSGFLYRLSVGPPFHQQVVILEGDEGAVRAIDGRVDSVSATRRPRRHRAPRAADPETALLDLLRAAAAGADPGRFSVEDNVATIRTVEDAALAVTR